jgi:hypothetical protein
MVRQCYIQLHPLFFELLNCVFSSGTCAAGIIQDNVLASRMGWEETDDVHCVDSKGKCCRIETFHVGGYHVRTRQYGRGGAGMRLDIGLTESVVEV